MVRHGGGLLSIVLVVMACSTASPLESDGSVVLPPGQYMVGGTVGGLAGTLVLANGGDQLTVTATGAFAFGTTVTDGEAYAVTVATQPEAQTCTVANGQGVIAGADVTNVAVNCTHNRYLVGGTVSGLTNGTLVLQNNGGDPLNVTMDGTFTFATPIAHQAMYAVTVATNPADQRCVVTSGTGTIAAADVTNVAVDCIDVKDVGGTITGMVGGAVVLRLNDATNVTINHPTTAFNFADAVDVNGDYAVTVATEPTGQRCTVIATTTNVGSTDVTDVAVTCSVLAVKIDEVHARPATGARGDTNGDSVRDSGDDELVEIVNLEAFDVDIGGWVIATGASPSTRFTFPANTTLTPGQRAVVFGGGTPTGSFGTALVFTTTSLALTDAPASYTVALDSRAFAAVRLDTFMYGATTFGSSCTTACESVARDPNSGNLVPHTQLSGAAGVLWSPGVAPAAAIPKLNGLASSPAAGSTNAAISANVTVQLNMAIDPADVDGTHFELFASTCANPTNPVALSGIAPGGDATQVVLAHTAYFAWAQPHCVRVAASTRSAAGASFGTAASYEFTTVDPGPTYTIGGTISGLIGTVVLQNEGADDLTRMTDGVFQFATPWPDGAQYVVTVASQPANQLCTVANGSSTVMGAPVTDVLITCRTVHALGGTVSGLQAGSVTLVNSGTNATQVTFGGSQTFAFPPVAENDPYDVTVSAQPTGQHCEVANGQATMGTSDVSLTVTCRTLSVAIDEIHHQPATGVYGDTNGDGVRDTNDDEFIEIINRETFAVTIGGWTLSYGAGDLTRFTFPGGTTLAAGQRAVVFGGGNAIGGFGGASTFTGLSTGLTNTGTTVTLRSAAVNGLDVDAATYVDTSCSTTSCSSLTRDPPGTGAFVKTNTVSGSAGVLWSPGTPPTGAIPKLATGFSAPSGTNASVGAEIIARFNMFMSALTTTHLSLFQSSCTAPANPLTLTITPGTDASFATLVPQAPLAYTTTYCVSADATLQSEIGVPLGATATYEFTTRAAQSAPAANVVISEVGGCHVGTGATNPCGGSTTHDEFIELYNPTASAIDISGWFVQRRTASGGTTSCYATLPASTTIAARSYYLIGGSGYTAAHYAGSPAADLATTSTSLTGSNETVVLGFGNTCTSPSTVVDAVSAGAITDTAAFLQLPAFPTNAGDSGALERKACFDSTGDTDMTTGLHVGGGHEDDGNSERIGASNADWTLRATANPQSSMSTAETRACP